MSIRKLLLKANGHLLSRNEMVDVVELGDMDPFLTGAVYWACAICDVRPKLRVTDDAVEVLDPCPHPNGITTTVTLNVPSGQIILTDNLRPTYDCDRDGFASYNSTLGQSQVVHAMASVGCAFGPVLDTSPGLYRTGTDSYVIAGVNHDVVDHPVLREDARLASICTDLWAYSIADVDHWKARGGDPATLGWKGTIVDIPPGVYEFTHHAGERGFDHHADVAIFAKIERIAPVA